MQFRYKVTVDVGRITGKFVSREDIADAITEALEALEPDLSGLGADGDSEYEVAELTVEPL